MFDVLKKLFLPSFTDKKVATINTHTTKTLQEASRKSKENKDYLKKNTVFMQIVVAAGGERRHD